MNISVSIKFSVTGK